MMDSKKHLFLFSVCVSVFGCNGFLTGLRPDLDDRQEESPTVGGAYPEYGFLGAGGGFSDRYRSVGHSERGPEERAPASHLQSRDLVSRDSEDETHRDAIEPTSYSQASNLLPGKPGKFKFGSRAKKADFIDDSQTEGSLWASNGQTNYYFTKNKIRSTGDIVTIVVDPPLVKDVSTEIRRSLNPKELEYELMLAQNRINAKVLGQPDPDPPAGTKPETTAQRAPAAQKKPEDGKEAEEPEIPVAKWSDIDIGRSLDIKAGDTILAEIVERYPNGNYKIRGTKRIPYKVGTPRLVTLVGVAKAADISEEETIASAKLFEYRLEAHQ